MKIQILNKEGKKVKEMETELFEEPIREDIIFKVVEAEKIGQPYSPKYRAGMDISASGNVSHRRHRWRSDRGRGLSRIPRKAFWRRGTQFSWEGAIIPSTKGGRRAHPPKGAGSLAKINKKELKKALLSALSYVANSDEILKKYSSIDKIDAKLPLVVEGKIIELNTRDFLISLKKILGNLYNIAVKKKSIRAGIGKMRGRKYKRNAGLLFVVGDEEDKNIKGIEVVKVSELSVSDLANNGARLTLFSEKAVETLGSLISGKKEKVLKEKKEKKLMVDRRKVKRENRKKRVKKKVKKTDEVNEDE